MEDLEAETQRLLEASMAKSTRDTYKRGVSNFEVFRNELNLRFEWPAPLRHVTAFIAQLSIQGKSSSTINTYISALAYVHKINGWIDPTDNFIVKKLKEGCRRERSMTDSRRPISLPILKRLSELLPGFCKSTFEVRLFRAAFLLAFFGFLRVGEFTAPSKNDDGAHALSANDISLKFPDAMDVKIRSSKTDQRGNSTTLAFEMGSDKLICPITAMHEYLSVRPFREGNLFVHFGGDPLTRYQFNQLLKMGIKMMGLNPQNFSSHSFRIGAATSAAINGVPIDVIKCIGRWKSSAVKLYIRPHRVLHSNFWV